MNQPKSQEFVKNLSEFFKRDLISIPLIKKYPHQLFNQRCGLKASTLELDTSAFPNIEYIAGNRLSVYPVNPNDHVDTILKHVIDDLATTTTLTATATATTANNNSSNIKINKKIKLIEPWDKFVQLNGRDSVKMALFYLYDIMTAPSRDLIRMMAENCSNKEHKSKLIAISRTDESWEKWICQSLRTLKSTLDEFNSCFISAKSLFSELTLQQPRQYSISSIKSNKRFRTEIIVFQHKFTAKSIAYSLQQLKELEYSIRDQPQDGTNNNNNNNNNYNNGNIKAIQSPLPTGQIPLPKVPIHIDHNDTGSQRSSSSVRSLRSMIPYGTSPITTQQVKRVPTFSGPLMSLYASSSQGKPVDINIAKKSQASLRGKSLIEFNKGSKNTTTTIKSSSGSNASTSLDKQYDGLCSNYLLNLNANDYIVCEFVENPRFTLKGNRERPIMMIGQDIGLVAYRAFWQQRALEHDRAQVFYTLFKDLPPKKFGDIQLVCITGNRCKFEDLFRREINDNITNKIMSSAYFINKKYLLNLLDHASSASITSNDSSSIAGTEQQQQQFKLHQKLQIEPKELIELGKRISKLLVENNGCLYTCCDHQMTQAIEILTVESIARYNGMARDKIMALLPIWKGRQRQQLHQQPPQLQQQQQHSHQQQHQQTPTTTNKFLFTLENPFERAQIVQELYDVVS